MDPRAKNTPEKTGELQIHFSDTPGSLGGVKLAATTPDQAVVLMVFCASSLGHCTGTVVTSTGLRDTPDKSSGGGDDMEKRIIRLESDIEHIKAVLEKIQSDVKDLKHDTRAEFLFLIRIIIGVSLGISAGLAGIIAKVFGWI